MIRVILVGALGKMGQKVMAAINAADNFELACAVDAGATPENGMVSDIADFKG